MAKIRILGQNLVRNYFRRYLYILISNRSRELKDVFFLLLTLWVFAAPAQAKYGGGTGEPNDPYLIYTPQQMNEIGANPSDFDKYFTLMADIDLSGYTGTAFNIIGTGVYSVDWFGNPIVVGDVFTGVFDGNGHIISNFTYSSTDADFVGLFGVTSTNAEIKDLALVNPYVDAGTGSEVGALIGHAHRSALYNCYVKRAVVVGANSVGGLVGHAHFVVDMYDCYSIARVFGMTHVGGLAGYGQAHIFNCCSVGTVLGTTNVGGLLGYGSANMSNSHSLSGVWGGDKVGGLVGYAYYGDVSDCYSAGSVSGTTNVGGLVGEKDPNSSGTVTDSFWDWQTSGQLSSAGGTPRTTAEMQDMNTFLDAGWDFVGETENGISDHWAEPVDGGYPALWFQLSPLPPLPAFSGGVGEPDDPYLISTASELNSISNNSRLMRAHFKLVDDINLAGVDLRLIGSDPLPFSGSFDGNNHTISNFSFVPTAGGAGLFGNVDGGAVKDLGLVDPNVNGGTSWAWIGSLAGVIEGGATISNCYVKGGTVCGRFNIGGLVGEIDTPGGGIVSSCYATCNVTGSEMCIGGLVGRIESGSGGTVTKCYATGSVTSITDPEGASVGGLVGSNRGGTITESYATGSVVAGNNSLGRTGGLVGNNSSGTSITNCYATGSASGTFEVGGLAGGNFGVITNSYSTGSVSGTSDVGGLVGNDTVGEYTGTTTNSFWDVNSSGKDTSAGGTGLMTADMQTESTFTSAGWDFSTPVWTICSCGGNYPRLWWEEPRVYHVNVADGNDDNNGLAGETAFATIQTGINAAYGCEEVLVWPGVYTEELDFLGKAITVKSTAEPAVLRASAFYAVWFHSGEDANSIFKNFIIKDSYTAFYVFAGSPMIENVTVVDNENGVMAEGGANPNISNCIFWNNSSLDLYQCQARYSCIEDGSEGIGNISEDPLFVDPANGDYHLKSAGWRWSGNIAPGPSWTWDSVTSRCIDAGNPGSARGDELMSVPPDPDNMFGVDLRINMGAYGGTAQASMGPHNWALLADLNNDGVVNYADSRGQVEDWLSTASEQPGDLNRDGVVNMTDYALLAGQWLQETDWAQ